MDNSLQGADNTATSLSQCRNSCRSESGGIRRGLLTGPLHSEQHSKVINLKPIIRKLPIAAGLGCAMLRTLLFLCGSRARGSVGLFIDALGKVGQLLIGFFFLVERLFQQVGSVGFA